MHGLPGGGSQKRQRAKRRSRAAREERRKEECKQRTDAQEHVVLSLSLLVGLPAAELLLVSGRRAAALLALRLARGPAAHVPAPRHNARAAERGGGPHRGRTPRSAGYGAPRPRVPMSSAQPGHRAEWAVGWLADEPFGFKLEPLLAPSSIVLSFGIPIARHVFSSESDARVGFSHAGVFLARNFGADPSTTINDGPSAGARICVQRYVWHLGPARALDIPHEVRVAAAQATVAYGLPEQQKRVRDAIHGEFCRLLMSVDAMREWASPAVDAFHAAVREVVSGKASSF